MMGKTIGGYRIIDKLGEGGMGLVYLAEHRELDRQAVVKVLHPHMAGNEVLARRFVNEAKAAASIHHPGIVDIMDAGHHDTGFYYILMEHLEGELLTDRMHREGHLSEDIALSFTRQIARALGAAHAKKIVHRDLKPDNLFIIKDPEVAGNERIKILDFGIAKLMENDVQVTQSGTLMGSPPYMSPEQCLGADEIDHRSDLYSLGVMLFQMICGRLPFERKTTGEYIVAHTTADPPTMRSVFADASARVDAVVARLLSKEAKHRYQSTEELLNALSASGFAATATSEASAGFGRSPTGEPTDEPTEGLGGNPSGYPGNVSGDYPGDYPTLGGDIGNRATEPGLATAATQASAVTEAAPVPVKRGVPMVALVAGIAVVGALAAGGFALLGGGGSGDKTAASESSSAESVRPAEPTVQAQIGHIALEGVAPMPFVQIDGGQFTMGSPGVETGYDTFEGPRHRVVLSPFEIGQYEVTQKQWSAVMGDNPSDCAFGCGDDMPVQNVSWSEAIRFANKLSQKHGLQACYQLDDPVRWNVQCDGYRLPTEAEWESVARAGTHTRWSFGEDEAQLRYYAWYSVNGDKKVHPVGELYPNPLGLYDIYGNVWEWTWDGRGDYASGTAKNPTGPSSADTRMLRGGCYLSASKELRSAYRVDLGSDVSFEYLGLRLAKGSLAL